MDSYKQLNSAKNMSNMNLQKKKNAKYYNTDIKISCCKRKEIKVFLNIVATMMDDKHGPKHFCFVRWKLKC